jgi:hypothetical protein
MKRRLGDRRGRPRFEIVGELWGTLDTVIGLPLVNVGKGGALVRSSIPLAPESVHHVSIDCGGQPTHTSVQVRHVRSVSGIDGREHYLVGLSFLSMPAALVAQIDAWMNEGSTALADGA